VPQIRKGVRGYVAGYNAYLAQTGVDNLPDARCRGQGWVRPITEMDAFRRFYQLTLLASQGVAIDGIADAAPPTPDTSGGPVPGVPGLPGLLDDVIGKLPLGDLGSNAVALGRTATASGNGLLLGNPHFPWDGPERFYEAQLTIPGKVNVTGASLFGVPLVLIGHTRGLAWSHTVSTAFRFTPFELRLVPGSPTTYLVDGRSREMRKQVVTVQARRPDGSLEPRSRTLYSTEYGPIFTSLLGTPLFPWTPTTADAMGDANATNFRLLNHFFEVNLAQSTPELDAVERRYEGIPWVNTIAADHEGRAYYADIGSVPHVTDAHAQRCTTGALGQATRAALGLPVLDGSQSSCRWGSDPDAAIPGIFGAGRMPALFRDDYVTNSNDSYWLANPEQPLEGFARIIGDERTERSLRTRLGLRIVQDQLAQGPFTRRALQDAVFNNRQHAGELMRDDLVAFCRTQPDLAAACDALAAWDLHDDLDSRGAVLFRRFASRLFSAGGGVASPPGIWLPFDASDPVNTPRGLNTANPLVEQSLRGAVSDVQGLGKPLDVPLREVQFEQRGDERIPIHGGPGDPIGVFNAVDVPWVPGRGYPNVPHGSSFVMVADLDDDCPSTRAILTYSLSTNAASPWFADQTRMFSDKKWVRMRFCQREILRSKRLAITQMGRARCAREGEATARFPLRRHERLSRVKAKVDGARTDADRRGRREVAVSLDGTARGTHRIKVKTHTNRGRTITVNRTARHCAA